MLSVNSKDKLAEPTFTSDLQAVSNRMASKGKTKKYFRIRQAITDGLVFKETEMNTSIDTHLSEMRMV